MLSIRQHNPQKIQTMKMAGSGNLLKQILDEKQLKQEKERVALLKLTIDTIQKVGPVYSVSSAYISGSLIMPERFRSHSDIDIAVLGLTNQNYFSFMAKIQEYLPRQVEVIELENCRFAKKILDTGLKVI